MFAEGKYTFARNYTKNLSWTKKRTADRYQRNSQLMLCSVKELHTRKAEFYRVVMTGRKGHVEKAIWFWKIDYFTDTGSN